MSDGKLGGVGARCRAPAARATISPSALGIDAGGHDGAHHAARRRLRPQVQMRLRHRGGAAVQGDGRRAGQGGVDARGRHPARLLSHRDGGALRSWPRRQTTRSWPGGTAARRRASWPTSRPIRSIPSTSSSAWAGSIRRSTCPTSAWRAARRRATCGSAGSAPSTTWRMPGRSSPSSPRSPISSGSDPKDFLLELIGPARIVDPREAGHHAVVELRRAASRPIRSIPGGCGRWPSLRPRKPAGARQLPKGQGLGIAAHRSFVSYIATVVHVEVGDKGNITIPRVDTAIDCGFCVHPERVRSQIEGAAVMGLTLAKYGEITSRTARVEQSNFNDYPARPASTNRRRETRVHIVEQRHRRAGERRRRAGRAAVRAGALQRHLRRHRQAHPPAADRRSAGVIELTPSGQEGTPHHGAAPSECRSFHVRALVTGLLKFKAGEKR